MDNVQNNNNRINGSMNNKGIKKSSFKVNPLDIGIVTMHYNLLKRCELEIPEHGDFATIVEIFESKNPGLEISDIKAVCKNAEDKKAPDKRVFEISVKNRAKDKEYNYTLFTGTKSEILNFLNDDNKTFFEATKELALKVHDLNKRLS